MKIEIKKIKDNKDGSTDVEINCCEEGTQFLMQQGLIATLVEAIVQEKTGEKYNVSDVLATLSTKSSKKTSRKKLEKVKSGGTD